jgi:hypothetical protein
MFREIAPGGLADRIQHTAERNVPKHACRDFVLLPPIGRPNADTSAAENSPLRPPQPNRNLTGKITGEDLDPTATRNVRVCSHRECICGDLVAACLVTAARVDHGR